MYHERVPETFRSLPRAAVHRRAVWAALLPHRGRAAFRCAVSVAIAFQDRLTIEQVGLAIDADDFAVDDVAFLERNYGRCVVGNDPAINIDEQAI